MDGEVNEVAFRQMRSRRPAAFLVTVLGLFVFVIPPAFIHAAQERWLVVQGQGIGSLSIGMEPDEVTRTWGPPAATSSASVWTYAVPIKTRVTFSDGRVLHIESWDSKVRTASNVRIGTEVSEAMRLFGDGYVKVQAGRGYWLTYYTIGLGVYIRNQRVAALSVFYAQLAPVASPVPNQPDRPVSRYTGIVLAASTCGRNTWNNQVGTAPVGRAIRKIESLMR